MGYVTLKSGRGTVRSSQIQPIPIDGKTDAGFYYAPIRMASVTEGTIKLFRAEDYTYYMDRFRSMTYEGQIISDMIEQENLKFVHEVQHWLREHFQEDSLKFRGRG